jgi:hypothetical protein
METRKERDVSRNNGKKKKKMQMKIRQETEVFANKELKEVTYKKKKRTKRS